MQVEQVAQPAQHLVLPVVAVAVDAEPQTPLDSQSPQVQAGWVGQVEVHQVEALRHDTAPQRSLSWQPLALVQVLLQIVALVVVAAVVAQSVSLVPLPTTQAHSQPHQAQAVQAEVANCWWFMLAKHAYIDANGLVVQIISGALDGAAHDALLRDYAFLSGAVRCVRVEDETPIWIGGSYTDGVFAAPPEPEPLPEPLPEPQPEPEI